MSYTIEMVKAEIEPNREEMMKAMDEHDDIPTFLRTTQRFIDVWLSGCWLNRKLQEAECPDDRNKKIGFEHGQRSFHYDPYRVAAELFNQFEAGTLEENPGNELAEQLLNENIEMRGNTMVLKVGGEEAKDALGKELDRLQALSPEELQAEKDRIGTELRQTDEDLHR